MTAVETTPTLAPLVAKPRRHRLACGGLPLLIVLVLNGVVFSQASAEVYTGTNAHGIRWYSDTAPVQGPYQVVPSSIPRLEAEPPVASTPTNIAVEGDAASTSAVKSRAKSSSTLASPKSATPNASRSKSSRSVSPRISNPRSNSPRKSRRTVMSQRERQAAALLRRCQRYDVSLRKIHSELRAGYRAAKGRKLRQRRRELQALQFAECPIR